MALKHGMKIRTHTVTSPIGSGGMREVDQATDTNLAYEVAIEVLSEA